VKSCSPASVRATLRVVRASFLCHRHEGRQDAELVAIHS
jgi:hypothetical protein